MSMWCHTGSRWLGVLFSCGLTACTLSVSPLDTLTQAPPDSTRARAMRRLNLASAYYEQNQNEVARQEVRAALQIDPQFAQAYSLLGLIHQRAQAPALAQQSFEQALLLAAEPLGVPSELAAIQHNYGWFLCEQKRFAEAQTQFDRALSQPLYAEASKTSQAVEFCQARAAAMLSMRERNN